jgi:hypothetical protein
MASSRHNLSQFGSARPARPRRSHPTLDEQSFQNLLSAAFTIQEHNDRLKKAQPTQSALPVSGKIEATIVCPHCGALKATEESNCPSCKVGKFRPGERLQRNWASMWLMSQQRELFPERVAEANEVARKARPDLLPHPRGIEEKRETISPLVLPRLGERKILAPPTRGSANDSDSNSPDNGLLDWPAVKNVAGETIASAPAATEAERELETDGSVEGIRSLLLDRLAVHEPQLDELAVDESKLHEPGQFGGSDRVSDGTGAASNWAAETSADVAEQDRAAENSEQELESAEADDSYSAEAPDEKDEKKNFWHSLTHLRVKLRVHRANLYLGAAVSVAALALLWPTVSAPSTSTLGPMDRALVALGLAEVPAPVAHVKGDPKINVWVDPHTALYYCPGEEQYGKTVDGRVSSQRDAQMDRFEPAAGSVCE